MIRFKRASRRKNDRYKLPDVLLESGRVYLCPPTADDWKEWLEVRQKNQEYLAVYEPSWSARYAEQDYYLNRLEKQKIEWEAGRGAYFLIHHAKNHNIIGGVNLNNISMGAARYASLGYWLDHDYEGQGYMRESIASVIDYAFNTLELRRLNAACLIENNRSARLLQSLGFAEEGLAKKYLQINGAWQDHRLFGLINENL